MRDDLPDSGNDGFNGQDPGEESLSLSGSLLIAHPALQDPNFRRAVVLLSAHSNEEGALGVVLNRPLGQTLGELKAEFAISPLADVPLYIGGPVNQDQMILTAWKWKESEGEFQLFFGLTPEKAESLRLTEPGVDLRGYLGYSGWGEGQLEGEVGESAWVVAPIVAPAIQELTGDRLWRSILTHVSPELRFLADLPDDPSVN